MKVQLRIFGLFHKPFEDNGEFLTKRVFCGLVVGNEKNHNI